VEGGVQLGPFDTAATIRPIVPALGDYDDGEIGEMMVGNKHIDLPWWPFSFPNFNFIHILFNAPKILLL
jgi:hypothetical protein